VENVAMENVVPESRCGKKD